MAYEPNIAPGTDPTPYDVVDISETAPVFVIIKGGFYETVVGAKSRARVDLPYYDGSTTRDEVDAGFIGRGPVSVLTNTGIGTVSPFSGDVAVAGNTTTVLSDEIATMMQQSDSFTHVPPHQNVLAKTFIRYYDGAGATGNVVGEFDVSRYVGEGGRIPQYTGSVPPTYAV